MKRLDLIVPGGLALVLFIAGMAFAQWQGGQGRSGMSCQERFDSLDANHDGKLTKEEFMAAPHHRGDPEEMFKAMDVNGHGYLTKDEFCSGQGMGRRGMRRGQGRESQPTAEEIKENQATDQKVDDAITKAWKEN